MLYLFDKLMDRYADRKTGMYRVQPNSEKKKFLKKQSERSRKITAARNVTNMKKKKNHHICLVQLPCFACKCPLSILMSPRNFLLCYYLFADSRGSLH